MTKFLSHEGLTTLIAKLKSYFAAKNEAIKAITGSGNKTLSFTRADLGDMLDCDGEYLLVRR